MNIAICLRGIEDIAAQEVNGKKTLPGRVEFSGDVTDFRSVNDVYEVLHSCTFNELDDIETEAEKLQLHFSGSVKVDCIREGEHNFNSVDVEKIVSTVLRKKGFAIDFKKADNTILVDVLDKHCIFGIPKKRRLQKREYRVKINNQGINACLAYAMLKLAGYEDGMSVLDPFCKDGTILIEAGLTAPGTLHGNDANKNNVRNARLNAAMAKVPITFHTGDAANLPEMQFDCAASYPPFESKRRTFKTMQRVYKEFFEYAAAHVKGKIALLSPNKSLLDAAQDLKLNEEREVWAGKQKFFAFIFECKKTRTQ